MNGASVFQTNGCIQTRQRGSPMRASEMRADKLNCGAMAGLYSMKPWPLIPSLAIRPRLIIVGSWNVSRHIRTNAAFVFVPAVSVRASVRQGHGVILH